MITPFETYFKVIWACAESTVESLDISRRLKTNEMCSIYFMVFILFVNFNVAFYLRCTIMINGLNLSTFLVMEKYTPYLAFHIKSWWIIVHKNVFFFSLNALKNTAVVCFCNRYFLEKNRWHLFTCLHSCFFHSLSTGFGKANAFFIVCSRHTLSNIICRDKWPGAMTQKKCETYQKCIDLSG